VKPYRFIKEANLEFQDHIAYYDEQASGLGDKFIADVHAIVSDIRVYPASGRLVSRNLRKRVLRVFRHNIFYLNEPDEIIIVALAPHWRRQKYWRSRLRNLR
jgi:ParE toxin of type II toxin-antitoxin system, parDE